MRNALFVVFIVAISASACVLEEEELDSEVGEAPAAAGLETPADDDGASLAGCSVVEYCQAPGGDGTRCRQTGCSVPAAIAECKADVAFVCGAPICPFIFTSITGARRDLCLN